MLTSQWGPVELTTSQSYCMVLLFKTFVIFCFRKYSKERPDRTPASLAAELKNSPDGLYPNLFSTNGVRLAQEELSELISQMPTLDRMIADIKAELQVKKERKRTLMLQLDQYFDDNTESPLKKFKKDFVACLKD